MDKRSASHITIASSAAVAYLSSLLLIYLTGLLRHTHAAGAAIIPFFEGLLFGVLAPFIWRGSRWALIGTFVVSLITAVAIVKELPADMWLAVPFPAVFGLLTACALIMGSPTPAAASNGDMIPKAYAALVYLYSFVAVFLWPDSVTY